MTEPSHAFEKLPHWPRWLNQRLAAAYVGVSAGKFRTEYLAGVWPDPKRGCLWDRQLLDLHSDRLSGLRSATFEDLGYSQDPGYFNRRIKAAYGDE